MRCFNPRRTRLVFLSLMALVIVAPLAAEDRSSNGTPDFQQPQLLSPINLIFPFDLRHIAHQWSLGTVRLRIDTEGRVVDWIPIDLPHYKLIPAIDRALADARFSPAITDGKPVAVDLPAQIPLDEAISYRVISETLAEHIESMQARMNPRQYQVVISSPDELDEPLTLNSSSGAYSVADDTGKLVSGHALVSFFVDTDGIPHMIHVDETSDPALFDAAYLTVENLRFEPPRRNRQPTVVRARIPVMFGEG